MLLLSPISEAMLLFLSPISEAASVSFGIYHHIQYDGSYVWLRPTARCHCHCHGHGHRAQPQGTEKTDRHYSVCFAQTAALQREGRILCEEKRSVGVGGPMDWVGMTYLTCLAACGACVCG